MTRKAIITAFREITFVTRERERAIFFLEIHKFDLDDVVTTTTKILTIIRTSSLRIRHRWSRSLQNTVFVGLSCPRSESFFTIQQSSSVKTGGEPSRSSIFFGRSRKEEGERNRFFCEQRIDKVSYNANQNLGCYCNVI